MAVIHVEESTAALLQQFCEDRDIGADEALGFMIRSFSRTPHLYDAEDTLEFGKYRGEVLSDVMVMDPGYVAWMDRTATGVGITEAARHQLRAISEGLETPSHQAARHGKGYYDDRYYS